MNDPFRPLAQSIPVQAHRGGLAPDGTVLIHLAAPHKHGAGTPCPACEAQTDIRAHLFDLLLRIRAGDMPLPSQVVVDAPGGALAITEALTPGKIALRGLRDRTVLRSFHPAG